jgi:hypothetical protein
MEASMEPWRLTLELSTVHWGSQNCLYHFHQFPSLKISLVSLLPASPMRVRLPRCLLAAWTSACRPVCLPAYFYISCPTCLVSPFLFPTCLYICLHACLYFCPLPTCTPAACLGIWLHACMSARVSVCLSTSKSVCLLVFGCLRICLPQQLRDFLLVRLCVCMSANLPACLYVCLHVYLSARLSISRRFSKYPFWFSSLKNLCQRY